MTLSLPPSESARNGLSSPTSARSNKASPRGKKLKSPRYSEETKAPSPADKKAPVEDGASAEEKVRIEERIVIQEKIVVQERVRVEKEIVEKIVEVEKVPERMVQKQKVSAACISCL